VKVARDLDAEARATFTDDQALGLGRVAPTPGESSATTEQVPVLLLEPRMAMMMVDPATGEAAEGQAEAIIKAGLQRLTWPAGLVQPAAGWTLHRTADGVELRDAHGGPWVRCAVLLEPRWSQVLVLYGVRLGVRVPPKQGSRRYGPAERWAELKQARQAGIATAQQNARPVQSKTSASPGRSSAWALPGKSSTSLPRRPIC
jgi:hypothetical protein